jgi:hypothetical protein
MAHATTKPWGRIVVRHPFFLLEKGEEEALRGVVFEDA